MSRPFLLLALLTSSAAAAEPGITGGLRKALHEALYSIEQTGSDTFRGANPAQNLSFSFDSQGAQLIHPDGTVAFHLSGSGYGDGLPVSMKSSGRRLEYHRAGMIEWYQNGAGGLEQGFTLASRPAPASHGLLTIALDVTGTLPPSQTSPDADVQFGTALRYAGLTAIDARGRHLPAHLELHARQIRLLVDDRDAKYPLTIDPTWSQQQQLTASDGTAGDYFGYSVAISGDTALIGAYAKTPNTNPHQGAAYVFTRTAGVWNLQQRLTSFNGRPNSIFGYSVALNGNVAMIGAPYNVWGAVYVFMRSGSFWTQMQEIDSPDTNAFFGTSVALGTDSAVIGGPGMFPSVGAAYVFARNEITWTFQQKIVPSGTNIGSVGTAVALSGDTLLIGAPNFPLGFDHWHVQPGSAYVYVRSGSSWLQQQQLFVSDAASNDSLGEVLSLDGDTAVIGCPVKNNQQGTAYVFVRNAGVWSQQQELRSSDGAPADLFGTGVAVAGDTIVVGAPGKTGNFAASGAAYVYTRSGLIWTQSQQVTASDAATNDGFGNAIALSAGTAVIGASNKSPFGNTNQGSAYVFTTPVPASITLSATPNPASFGQRVTLTATVSPSSAAGTVTFLDGTSTLAAATLTSGIATTALSTFALGSHSLTAVYSGDLSNLGSTSIPLVLNINPGMTISGTVTLAGPFSGVTMTLTGLSSGSTHTDSSGFYSFTGLAAGGTYVITPSLSGYTFSPPSQTLANLTADRQVNFQASTMTFLVSGQVTANGGALSGAVVTVNGNPNFSTITDSSGKYSIALLQGGTYRINAAMPFFIFGSPVNISLTADQTVNFSGTPVSGLAFYPVAPCRIADTRAAAGFTGKFGPPAMLARSTRSFNIPASSCGIPANAAAYSLNFTAIPPAGGPAANLTVWPATQPDMPNVSTLNYSGSIVANAAIVPAGADAAINVYANQPTELLFDINGYFAVPVNNNGFSFVPITPCRIADTRTAAGFSGSFGPPSLVPTAARSFNLATVCGIPSGAAAYSLNFTVVPPPAGPAANLTSWPTGQVSMPNVSTLNYSGAVVANAAIVPASAAGAISVFANQPTDMLFDVNGYFSAGSGGLKFYPVPPCRIADTRTAAGFTDQFGPPALIPGAIRTFRIQQSACGIPSTAAAFSLNFTVVPPAGGPNANLTAFPAGPSVAPTVSTLNYSSAVVANAAIVPAGAGGSISLYVNFPADVLFDINGYFAP